MIDRWFPCDAVDRAVGTSEGSGRSEKAILTWFASRPVAQARAAVLTALLDDDPALQPVVEAAIIEGRRVAIDQLVDAIRDRYDDRLPVVLDVFSGRGMIPLEAARFGATAVGLDLSPVATLGGRLLAEYPLRDWSAEPAVPFLEEEGRLAENGEPRLVRDVRTVLAEVGRRVANAVERLYPRNPDGSFPWGYLWAVSMPCDACRRRFPLVGSLVLRHPYRRTDDPGQSYRILTEDDSWRIELFEGPAVGQPTYTAAGRKGKSARCSFCGHVHNLETVKAKGFAGEYRDELLLAADLEGDRKVFRLPRKDEREAVRGLSVDALEPIAGRSAFPDEEIPPGNVHTVMASGYGYKTYGELMCARQTLQFVETSRAIQACHRELLETGLSPDYAAALASYAGAALVRKIRRSTRGARLLPHGGPNGAHQNRVQADHIFANESKLAFQFDYFEAGPGEGPGTWRSICETGVTPLAKVCASARGRPGRFRTGNAMALPYRDASVDAIVTDPPYLDMIEYSDASDLFYVWLKRALAGIQPDLFDGPPLQNKDDEIIVRRVYSHGVVHDRPFYEGSLERAFKECRRVLKPEGVMVVVFGHSDPEAWKLLLRALHEAGFVVTSSWPSRTESGDSSVAAIKVTVTIGCGVAPAGRPVATAADVDREVVSAVKDRVGRWERDGLALTDQLMAAYGPAMEVYGRYSTVVELTGEPAPLERYLTLARTAVRDAVAMKVDSIPLEAFDARTRFAVFWMRLYGRTNVSKGEARFLAQADSLRIDDVRDGLLDEARNGYRITLAAPERISAASTVFDVVRAMASAWHDGGAEAVAEVVAAAERPPEDEQVWAIAGELARLLPDSDETARALTGIQRTAVSIKGLARGASASTRQEALALFETPGEAE
jgi:putative DNA methylase